MNMVVITQSGYKCLRCGHTWVPRKKDCPRICPKCKSPYWDREKKITKRVGTQQEECRQGVV